MKRFIFISACFFLFQYVAPVDALDSKRPGLQAKDFPHAFLPHSQGNVLIRKGGGGSISLSSNRSTLEEILEKIAVEKKVVLKFYCSDPSLKHERAANLSISADSLVIALRQLLPEDLRFAFLNREGKPLEDEKDVATVNIYPKDCAKIDDPVRVFVAEKEHPLLRKPPEEISLEELRNLLKRGGPASRRRAADILGLKGDEKAIPYAKEALKDENPGVMIAAANALKRLGGKFGSQNVAGAVYERFREKPYAELLPIMAEIDKEKIWTVIDGSMDQSGEREQNMLTRALSLTNDRRAIPYLSRIASTGKTENSRQAIYAIGKIGGPEAATILMRLLRREGDAQRQARAAQAVPFLPKGEGSELRAEVENIVRKERVSEGLIHALVEVSYLEPLEKLMKDPAPKPDLKIRALRAMAERGSEKTIYVMSAGLNDKVLQVRIASVEAMGTVISEAAIPYLIKATHDKDAKVRSAAVKGLSEFPGDDGVVQALGKAVNDPDENVRRGTVDALHVLGKPSEAMIAILKDCKNHKDPYVANKTMSILRYWGLEK